MDCWLLYKKNDSLKNKEYINMYFRQCKKRNINILLLIEENMSFSVINNSFTVIYNKKSIALPDFAINRTRNFKIAQMLEFAGVKVYNSSYITQVCNDKMLTLSKISSLKINVCDTFLNEKTSYPFIFKSLDGHGGSEVFEIKCQNEYEDKKNKLNSFITQKIVSDLGKDLRVYVIGKEIIASMLRTNENDFRSNFSLGGKAEAYNLSENEKAEVKKIINAFDFGMVGIDFIFDNNKIVFNEIEDAVGARMLYQNTDIDIVTIYLDYIIKDIA